MATETVTVETQQTPTGVVESRTVETEEGDITESWLEERFTLLVTRLETQAQQLSALMESLSQHRQKMEVLEARLPSNLTELLQNQNSMITNLVAENMQTVRSLLTPVPAPIVTPVPVVPAENVPTLVAPEVSAPAEPPSRKRRAV